MFENALGRLINGAIWGIGAGLVLTVVRSGEPGLRPMLKSAMKAYIAASDRVQEMTAEARESLEDLYVEVKSERQNGAPAQPIHGEREIS